MNVGQGDSILIISNQKAGLIDAGPGSIASERIANYLLSFSNTLEFLVLTHFDQDHIEGFLRIANSFKIKNLYISNSNKENYLIEEIKKTSINKNIPTYFLDSMSDFEFENFEMNVLWPNPNINITSIDSNDFSIGFEIKNEKCNIYTAGDLSSEFETQSIVDLSNKNIEVLKAGHHGSKTSTSADLVSQTNPDISIISAGENNRYGHPHKETISTLLEGNSTILQTKNGDIEIDFATPDLIQITQQNYISNIQCF